jgi:gas vesicle protein
MWGLHESTDTSGPSWDLQFFSTNRQTESTNERLMIMRNFGTKNAKDWVRLAAKLSLLFTEPKVRAAIGDRLKNSVNDLTDNISDKYEGVADAVSSKYDGAVDRLEAAADAIQGKNDWGSKVAGFLLGVGIGAGLGILLAPASGSETRELVREKAADVKSKIRNFSRTSPTGTEG